MNKLLSCIDDNMKSSTKKVKNGIIIAFEGMDCSFKETNSLKLYKYIKKYTNNVVYASFPSYDEESSYFVKEFLKSSYGPPVDIDSEIGSVFYLVDIYHQWQTKLKKVYNNNGIVILDRYTDSNFIYQAIKNNDDTIEAVSMNKIKIYNTTNIFKLPKPDAVIMIDMPIDKTLELLAKKKNKDANELNTEYISKVHEWLKIYKEVNNFKVINALYNDGGFKTKTDIFNDILNILNIKEIKNKETL